MKIMKSPLVSVLVPVYNREHYIEECIQSALSQDYENIEVVVVDNCSNDNTFELCCKLAKGDARLRVYQNIENIGPVRNWMRCVELANGEYSKILFSDDLLLDGCLSRMMGLFDNSEIGLVYSAVWLGSSRSTARKYYGAYSSGEIPVGEYIDRILVADAPYSPAAALLRTADLREYLKCDYPTPVPQNFSRHGAGPDCLLQLFTAGTYPKVGFIAEPLVFFRSHSNSITAQNTNNNVQTGYISAISYFLMIRGEVGRFNAFLFLTWLRERTRGLGGSFSEHLRHGGSAVTALSLFGGVIKAATLAVRKARSSLRQRL
jgi:glycosyltransferase involved in cell wall biosynthesis